jgi:lipopolysaccharide transport system ATP-binding protein
MRRVEIDQRFDEIVAFAEVEKFVDTPVKHFSSGMYLRLAFSVAAHLEPEILLVDEVLAVGDAAFQNKCLSKMKDVGDAGRTVLFVSHDLTDISRLAPQTIFLQSGAVAFHGPTDESIRMYTSEQRVAVDDLASRKDRAGDGVIRMTALCIRDLHETLTDAIGSGEAVSMSISYRSQLNDLQAVDLALDMRFTDVLGHPITTFSTRFSDFKGSLNREGVLVCEIPSLALAEEIYGIDLWLAYRGALSDYVERAGELRVLTADYYGTGHGPVKRKHGAALLHHSWKVQERNVFDSASQSNGIAAGIV